VNFVLGILLARWVSPNQYGGFAVAYSIFLLISTLQVALIAEPMSIFGVSRQGIKTSLYLNILFRFQWLGSTLASVLLIAMALFVKDKDIRVAQIGMSISLPFTFAYWYLRRACYLEAQTSKALLTSAVYASSLIGLVLFLLFADQVSSIAAFLSIGLSSLLASTLSLNGLSVQLFGSLSGVSKNQIIAVLSETWRFGKWILAAYIANWIVLTAYPLVIAAFLGIEFAASFRTMQNLFLPLQQFLASITLLALPWMAKQRASRGNGRVLEISRLIVLATSAAAFVYCLLIVLFRRQLFQILYDNMFYNSFIELIPYLALASLLSVVPLMLGLSLRVLGKPEVILWSKGSSVFFMMTAGLLLVGCIGMNGVVLSLSLSALIELLTLLFFYIQYSKSLAELAHPG
jgi:O-antigen/teichoic acid export membrane protein